MMDFDNILDIASQNQGHSSVSQKRYSLQVGPPKKDPRAKGVNPAAVQALLKKKFQDSKKKEKQFIKKKEDLMAKRVELKSDRKARAMASRTKDNFKGYNGIPVVETPKKRRSKLEMQEERSMNAERFSNHSMDPENDEDNYEYEQTDSEPEPEPEPLRPGKSTGVSGNGNSNFSGKPSSNKNSGPPKSNPSHINFADLIKLAEKKQFEPVELKPKATKKEERLRTADEIRELEMERKAKRLSKDRGSNTDRERDSKSQYSSNIIKKASLEREQTNGKPQKSSLEKQNLPSGSGKKSHQIPVSNRGHSFSKPTVGDRERDKPKASHSDRDRSKTIVSGSSVSVNRKVPLKASSSQVSTKQANPVPSSGHKSSTSGDLGLKIQSSSVFPGKSTHIPGTRPTGTAGQKSQHGSSQLTKPSQGSSMKQGPTVAGHKSGKGEPSRPGVNSVLKSSGNSLMRTSGGPPKAGSQHQPRLGGTPQVKAGGGPQARPGGKSLQSHTGGSGSRPPGVGPSQSGRGGLVGGRLSGSIGSGPGRPKCTVVSETISSKNVGGPRLGVPPRPGMPPRPVMAPRPGMPPRPMMNRPPGTMLPPITSAYKRKYEDEEEEYDSEMDDFIDDGDDRQEEISKHIKEIFGYDRNKYKDESDYALKFMESSWKDVQKEEARSLKMAVQEDLEEEKREEEERKVNAKRKKIK